MGYLCGMDILAFRSFCLALPDVEETLPFDDVTLVYKVAGKMFAVIGLDDPSYCVVKCDPDRALLLRDRYDEVTSAWHFNTKHWNALRFGGRLSDRQVEQELRHSYLLVARRNVVPRARREVLLAQIAAAGIEDDSERFE